MYTTRRHSNEGALFIIFFVVVIVSVFEETLVPLRRILTLNARR
jgi:hypothetical protein